MKKGSASWKDCNKLWSDCVRQKAKGICQFCKKRPGTGAHHVIPRGYAATAHLADNGIWACDAYECHCHDNVGLNAKCIAIIGQTEYDRLWEIARKPTLLRKADLKEIEERLKKELNNLKNGKEGA